MKFKISKNRIHVYLEYATKRIYVGELKKNIKGYTFTYDDRYLESDGAISVGAELDLFSKTHHSTELFSSFEDRIPSRSNPAYKDYVNHFGLSLEEENKMKLLMTIGKRGASSFVFEPVFEDAFDGASVKKFRTELGLSQVKFALIFDFAVATVQNLEMGKSSDTNTLRRIEIYEKFPQVAFFQIIKNRAKIHTSIFSDLIQLYDQKCGMSIADEIDPILFG